jgi:AraC-like DNA-binding protein
MYEVARWRAPFDREPVDGFAPPEEVAAQPGEILLLREVSRAAVGGRGPSEVPELVGAIRRPSPGSPVVLWITDARPQAMIEAVQAASHAQVRAILAGERLDPALLRERLTAPAGLGSFVPRWAADAGYLPPECALERVRPLLEAAPEVRTLNRLCRDSRVASRTWRGHLRRLGLPAPAAWMALGHALHTAFAVQRHPDQPLHALAERVGMQTVANMNQRFRRAFGLSPGAVRELLGAEPLLHRWFGRRFAGPGPVHLPGG